jgi:hypothetical protein
VREFKAQKNVVGRKNTTGVKEESSMEMPEDIFLKKYA